MIKKLLYPILFLLSLCFAPAGSSYAGETEQDFSLRFEIPFGIGDNATAIIQGSDVQALICAESFAHRKIPIQLKIDLPESLDILGADDMVQSGRSLTAAITLRTENDTWYRLIRLRVHPEAPHGKHAILITSICDGKAETRTIPCWIIPSAYLAQNVRLLRFSIPSDENGRSDIRREENTLSIKDTNSRLLRSLFLGTRQPHDFAFAGAEFENSGDSPVTLNINYAILDGRSHAPVEWLNDLSEETGLRAAGLSYQLLLKPRSRETAVFKISGGDSGVPPGDYLQRLSAQLLSSGKGIIAEEFPLHIMAANMTAMVSAIVAVIIVILGVSGIIAMRKRIFHGFTSREYILIGLYAAVAFTLVSVPSTVVYSFFHSLMGPFSFLVTGIFSEVLFYLLLMSLGVLVSRPGAIFLFVVTIFFLNGLILGNFTVASVITYPAQAVILELALFASGLYERDSSTHEFRQTKNHSSGRIFWAALVFGIADAFFSYISFNLNIFVYRLYYAEWYILAYVFISGFLYTFVTVPFGIRMGTRLRCVAID